MKVWAKLIDDNRIIKDCVYTDKNKLTLQHYEEMLREISYTLDIPTPLILRSHFKHLKQFNIHKYTEKDFVETLGCHHLEIELVPED